MLCVDEGYFEGKRNDTKRQVDACLKKYSMTEFPNVMMPGGFDSVVRKTGKDGYGLMVINPKGIVLSMNALATTLPGLLPELF